MDKLENKQGGFGSRWGLLMTLIGISVGTGNFWRFPRVAALNGGGAFLIAYIVAFCVMAVPVMMAEHAIGRATRHGLPGAFKDFMGKKFAWMGTFMVCVVILVASCFTVVCAWVLRYLVLSVTKGYYGVDTLQLFESMTNKDPVTVLYFLVILFFTIFVVSKGISGGIEKLMKFMAPALLVCTVIVVIKSLTLDGAVAGLNYLFHIDTSYLLKPTTWLNAFTQISWSMGPGYGIILTYAVYTKANSDTTLNTFTQAISDNAVAILVSTAVFPTLFATFTAEEAYEIMASGNNGLTFVSLVKLFSEMDGGYIIAILFFVALLFAGLSSNFGHILVPSLPFVDAGKSKKKAAVYVGIIVAILGIPAAWNMDIFNNQDWVTGNLLLVGALFVCLSVTKFGAKKFRERFLNTPYDEFPVGRWFEICIAVLAPIIMIAILAWWAIQAIAWDPSGWWNPISSDSLGTVLVQGLLIAIVSILFNDKVGASVKNKYFNGETFPEIPPEHFE